MTDVNSDLKYLTTISSTLRDINKIVNLKRLSQKLIILREKLQQCSSNLERALAIDDFNADDDN